MGRILGRGLGQGRGFRLHHGQRVGAFARTVVGAIPALIAVAIPGPIVAIAVPIPIPIPIPIPVTTLALALARILALALALTVVAIAAIVAAALVPAAFKAALVLAAVLATLVLAIALTAIGAVLAVFALAIVRTPVAALAVFAAVTIAVAITIFLAAILTALVLALALAGFAALLGRRFGGLRFHRLAAALVLEVDVDARGEGVTADDLGRGALGLHGAQHPEIVLGVLQVILGQHPVARRRRIAGELLVLLEDVLGVAADLDAVGSVGIEGPVGVVLRLTATDAATAAAAAITAALPFHALEISHLIAEPS